VIETRCRRPGGHPFRDRPEAPPGLCRRPRPLAFSADGTTHVLCWEDGAQFLRAFLRLLDAADPDLLVTEYGDDCLLPRMLDLATRLGVPQAEEEILGLLRSFA
jgi:hypothetical protein